MIFFCSCEKQKNKETMIHKSYSHTFKLRKKIFAKFKSEKTISVDFKSEYKNISLQIFLKKKNNRKLLKTLLVKEPSDINFTIDEDLKNFDYIVALVKGIDMLGSPISAVDTYKIGEQDEINRIKERLKNRN